MSGAAGSTDAADTAPPSLQAMLRDSVQRLFADEAIPLAGNIAFRTLFAIFPFLIFVTALAGFFGSEDMTEAAVNYLLSVAPRELIQPLSGEIRSILTVPRTGLLSVSALATIWSAMGGVDSVRVGLNRAYDLREDRHWLSLYLQSVLFIIGSAAGLLIFAVLIVFAPVILALIERSAPAIRDHLAVIDLLRYPIAILLLTAWLLISHRVLPARPMRFINVLPGVVLTVVVWIVLSSVFSFYLVRFNTFASTYASLSGLFAAMFFLYLAALVLILGGEVNRVIAIRRLSRRERKRLRALARAEADAGEA